MNYDIMIPLYFIIGKITISSIGLFSYSDQARDGFGISWFKLTDDV